MDLTDLSKPLTLGAAMKGSGVDASPMSPMGPIRIFLITFLGRFLTAPAIYWQYAYCYGNDIWRHKYQVMKPV